MLNILLLTLLDGIIFGFGFAFGICILMAISDFIQAVYDKITGKIPLHKRIY